MDEFAGGASAAGTPVEFDECLVDRVSPMAHNESIEIRRVLSSVISSPDTCLQIPVCVPAGVCGKFFFRQLPTGQDETT